ncbi:hypothetical protein AB0K09_00425 [Streptomyces sp. NPDC049577]|uniref:hypothetical protein n=1 Tax=Streptomyces sp. NPDC049577 TaxID=3155153 RepID=UPI003434A8DC
MAAFDPLDINGLTYDGIELRRAALLGVMGDGTALGARPGIRPGEGGLITSLAGSTINVTAGAAWLYRSGQGVYRAALPATWSGTLTAAHATLDRIDLVYLRVWDNSVDASGLNQADVVYLAGTPSSTPVAPTPAGTQIYLPLATISVPHTGAGSPSVSLAVRPVTVAPGGIVPDAAASGIYAGQYRDNGTGLQRYDGTAWSDVQPQGIGKLLFARKTADTARSNTITATDDPHLSVPVVANAIYTVEGFIVYNTPNAADWKYQFALPSGSTQLWAPWGLSAEADTSAVGPIRTSTSTGGATQLGVNSTSNVSVRPVGLFRIGASSGNCVVQWAQGIANAGATTVVTDSWIKLQRVA